MYLLPFTAATITATTVPMLSPVLKSTVASTLSSTDERILSYRHSINSHSFSERVKALKNRKQKNKNEKKIFIKVENHLQTTILSMALYQCLNLLDSGFDGVFSFVRLTTLRLTSPRFLMTLFEQPETLVISQVLIIYSWLRTETVRRDTTHFVHCLSGDESHSSIAFVNQSRACCH
jgi:hypothetical protein